MTTQPHHIAYDEPRYSPAEAGRLLGGVSANTVRRWLGSTAAGDGVVHRARNTNWASFLDLIELHIALEIQRQTGVSTRALRFKLKEAAERAQLSHPLARRQFLVEGSKLWLPTEDGVYDLGEGGQLGLQRVIEEVSKNIEFDSDELARRWWPAGRAAGVVVDPMVAFGDPVIEATRINTGVLFDLWKAEGENLMTVAEAYELDPGRVRSAIEFEKTRRAA